MKNQIDVTKCDIFMTNKNNTVLYIGVTSNLIKRVYQHKSKAYKGFTEKYNCDRLVYFEVFTDINEAILREKQIKKGNRKKKNDLVDKLTLNGVIYQKGGSLIFHKHYTKKQKPSSRGVRDERQPVLNLFQYGDLFIRRKCPY